MRFKVFLLILFASSFMFAGSFVFDSLHRTFPVDSHTLVKFPTGFSECFKLNPNSLEYRLSCTQCSDAPDKFITISNTYTKQETKATINCRADVLLVTTNLIKKIPGYENAIRAYADGEPKQMGATLRFEELQIGFNVKPVIPVFQSSTDVFSVSSGKKSFKLPKSSKQRIVLNYSAFPLGNVDLTITVNLNDNTYSVNNYDFLSSETPDTGIQEIANASMGNTKYVLTNNSYTELTPNIREGYSINVAFQNNKKILVTVNEFVVIATDEQYFALLASDYSTIIKNKLQVKSDPERAAHKLYDYLVNIEKILTNSNDVYASSLVKIKKELTQKLKQTHSSYLIILGDYYSFPQPTEGINSKNSKTIVDSKRFCFKFGDSFYDPQAKIEAVRTKNKLLITLSKILGKALPTTGYSITQKLIISRIPFSNPWQYLTAYSKSRNLSYNNFYTVFAPDLFSLEETDRVVNALKLVQEGNTLGFFNKAFKSDGLLAFTHGSPDGFWLNQVANVKGLPGKETSSILRVNEIQEKFTNSINDNLILTNGCQAGRIDSLNEKYLAHTLLRNGARAYIAFLESDYNYFYNTIYTESTPRKPYFNETIGDYFLALKNHQFLNNNYRAMFGMTLYGDPLATLIT